MASKKWFKPGKETGWKKSQSTKVRRRNAISSTPKNYTMRKRKLIAGRRLQALANVTKDKPTRRKAKRDANYFFGQLR